MLDAHARDSFVHAVGVQVHQRGVSDARIQNASEVQRLVVLSSSNATAGLKAEHLLETLHVFGLHFVQAESDWNHHENALHLLDLLRDLVEEDVAIVADNHAEICQWFQLLVYFVKHVADGLGSVPIPGLPPVSDPNLRNAMDAERAHLLALNVVHEQAQESVVLIQFPSLRFVVHCFIEPE